MLTMERMLEEGLSDLNNIFIPFIFLKAEFRGGVAQWVARLTRDRWILVSRELEPHQRPPLFP